MTERPHIFACACTGACRTPKGCPARPIPHDGGSAIGKQTERMTEQLYIVLAKDGECATSPETFLAAHQTWKNYNKPHAPTRKWQPYTIHAVGSALTSEEIQQLLEQQS